MNSVYLCYLFSEKLETDNEQRYRLRDQKANSSPFRAHPQLRQNPR